MYGLEKQASEPLYDLEKDLKGRDGAQKLADLKKLLNSRIEELKGLLRKVDDKKEFGEYETLLHAYLACQKVVEKVAKK